METLKIDYFINICKYTDIFIHVCKVSKGNKERCFPNHIFSRWKKDIKKRKKGNEEGSYYNINYIPFNYSQYV